MNDDLLHLMALFEFVFCSQIELAGGDPVSAQPFVFQAMSSREDPSRSDDRAATRVKPKTAESGETDLCVVQISVSVILTYHRFLDWS